MCIILEGIKIPNIYSPKYRETHREQLNRAQKKYLETHPEMKEYFQLYYETHKEHLKELTKAWVKNHPDKVKEYQREYFKKSYKPHPRQKRFTSEELKQHRRNYLNRSEVKQHNKERLKNWRKEHPEEYKLRQKKQDFKRRGLGNSCLNKRFEGSHGHHVNFNEVVFIPESLHNSVWHNVWTGKGMSEINSKVNLWLNEQNTPISFKYIPITDIELITSKKRGRPRKEPINSRTRYKQLYNTLRYQRIKCGTIYPLAIYRNITAIQSI